MQIQLPRQQTLQVRPFVENKMRSPKRSTRSKKRSSRMSRKLKGGALSPEQTYQAYMQVLRGIHETENDLVARSAGLYEIAGLLGDDYSQVLPYGFWEDPGFQETRDKLDATAEVISDWAQVTGLAESQLRKYNNRVVEIGLGLLRGSSAYRDRITLEDIQRNLPPEEYRNMLRIYEQTTPRRLQMAQEAAQAAYEERTRDAREESLMEFDERTFGQSRVPGRRRRNS